MKETKLKSKAVKIYSTVPNGDIACQYVKCAISNIYESSFERMTRRAVSELKKLDKEFYGKPRKMLIRIVPQVEILLDQDKPLN